MAQRGEVASRRPPTCDFTVAEDDQLFLYAFDHNGLKHGRHRRNGIKNGYLIWANDEDELTKFTTYGVNAPNTNTGRKKTTASPWKITCII